MILSLLGAALGREVELHTLHQIGLATFPAGLQYFFEGEARIPLWNSDSVLLRDAHVAIIGHAEITPAFPRVGPTVRIAPVAVWDATFKAWTTWYFGAFSSILPFDDPSFRATPEAKRALVADGKRVSGWGVRFDAETRLKGRLGPVIAVLELQYRKHHVTTADGDLAWFWEPSDMLNLAADGEVINRNAYLFYEVKAPRAADAERPADDAKLWLGLVGFWQTSPQSDDRNIRLGPVAFWKPKDGPRWPTLVLGAQPWLDSNFAAVLPPYSFVAAIWNH